MYLLPSAPKTTLLTVRRFWRLSTVGFLLSHELLANLKIKQIFVAPMCVVPPYQRIHYGLHSFACVWFILDFVVYHVLFTLDVSNDEFLSILSSFLGLNGFCQLCFFFFLGSAFEMLFMKEIRPIYVSCC